jgi:hypothetical protein
VAVQFTAAVRHDSIAVAGEAVAARKRAELAQARTEAAASATERQAAATQRDARTERARADDLTAALAERTEQLAVRTAEHDALRDALVSLRGSSADTETELKARLDRATAAHATDRARLHDLEGRLHRTLQEHHDRDNEAAGELSEAREQSAALAIRLAESRHDTTTRTIERDTLQARLSRVHQIVLEPADEDASLRRRLLAELLDLE